MCIRESHYVDNLDAKLEMVKDAYANANETAPGIFERKFPLSAPLVTPLPSVAETEEDEADWNSTPPNELF